jgi:hypothetical protein
MAVNFAKPPDLLREVHALCLMDEVIEYAAQP